MKIISAVLLALARAVSRARVTRPDDATSACDARRVGYAYEA